MVPRAAELLSELETKKKSFLLQLDRLTDDQKNFRPRAEAWSPVQVADHVVRAERGSVNGIMKHRGKPSSRRSVGYQIGYAAVWLVLKLGLRVRNPVPAATPDDHPDFEKIRRTWDGARVDLRDHLESLPAEALQDAAWKHPIAGPLSVEDALLFLNRHLAHHTRQLDRICLHQDFPSDAPATSSQTSPP